MPKTLHGLTVLVTRPAHQASRFQQLLAAEGVQALLFPVVEVRQPDDLGMVAAQLVRLPSYDTALFISANAVTFGLKWLDTPQQHVLQHMTLGAIGKKTASALQQHGFTVQWVPATGFTSEDFLAMPQTQQLIGRRILIFRGEGGRELLADTLRQRGATVDQVDVYQRVCPKIDANHLKQHHEQRQLDIIAVTSSEGILNLLAMLDNPDWIKTVPLLVGSQRMLETARQAGFSGTLVLADNPSDEAMLQALTHWAQE
jgi:uroporphyrinogen-III synthase